MEKDKQFLTVFLHILAALFIVFSLYHILFGPELKVWVVKNHLPKIITITDESGWISP